MRIGFGIDVHPLGGPGPLRLGGVVVDPDQGVEATSDGDVAVHALIDALLGAAALGDLGSHFPPDDPQWEGASSMRMLDHVVAMLADDGHTVGNVDVTIVAQSVRVAPHRDAMRAALADALDVEIDRVSVKATTTDHLGMIGRDEGIAAMAVAALG